MGKKNVEVVAEAPVEEIKITREEHTQKIKQILIEAFQEVPEDMKVQVVGDISLTMFEAFYPMAGPHLLPSIIAEYINIAVQIDHPLPPKEEVVAE